MEALPNGMFRVRPENDTIIQGYISGKIRSSSIRILMGDRVNIEVSRYDSSKGRNWKGTNSALVASIGFLIIWICYFGINLLGIGLHSYSSFTLPSK